MSSVRGATCAVTPGERATRGVLAVLVGGVAYAAGTSGRLWCAVPAGVCGLFLAVGAATGWCPTNLLPRRRTAAIGTDHGYPDARDAIGLTLGAPGGRRS